MGEEIKPINVQKLTDITDYMIICTATSDRHAKALAEKLTRATREVGQKPIGTEGEQDGHWILIDFVDVVVHIMQAETREFYSLEKLWTITESSREGHAG